MKYLLVTTFVLNSFISSFAQSDSGATTNTKNRLSELLSSYYNIKNELVAGNANKAATNAEEFIKIANAIDYKLISEGNINALLKGSSKIADSKDINKQREAFINLSNNMIAIAKTITLSSSPIYLQYCPMKKASWLSNEVEIRNPYYGKQMLTCGTVTETINPKN